MYRPQHQGNLHMHWFLLIRGIRACCGQELLLTIPAGGNTAFRLQRGRKPGTGLALATWLQSSLQCSSLRGIQIKLFKESSAFSSCTKGILKGTGKCINCPCRYVSLLTSRCTRAALKAISPILSYQPTPSQEECSLIRQCSTLFRCPPFCCVGHLR